VLAEADSDVLDGGRVRLHPQPLPSNPALCFRRFLWSSFIVDTSDVIVDNLEPEEARMGKQTATFKLHGVGSGVAQRITLEGSANTIRTDAAPAFGGKDENPSPVAYVLAAVTSCTQVTAQLVARDLGVKLHRFEFDLVGDLDTAVLVGGAPGVGHFERVQIRALVETDASPEQFERLRSETERRCPVFQLYKQSGIALDTQWTRRSVPVAVKLTPSPTP
jgi:uncharacterized OsmC-like protein